MNQESPPYHDSNLSLHSFTFGKLYQWSFEHNPITQDKKITADFFIFFFILAVVQAFWLKRKKEVFTK